MSFAYRFGPMIVALVATACGASTHAWTDGVGECPAGTVRNQDSAFLPSSWWCELPDGTRHGPAATVHDNGRVERLGQYRNGERHGRWLLFDPLGTKLADVRYRDGKRDGTWRAWYANGARLQRQRYADGDRDGTWLEWWEGGRMREQRQFDRGQPHGRFAWWDENGELLRTERYERGRLLETVRYIDGSEAVEISRSAP